jgi:hypothetical protein
VKLTTHLHLVKRLKTHGDLLHSPIRFHGVMFSEVRDVFMALYLVKHRDFIFLKRTGDSKSKFVPVLN